MPMVLEEVSDPLMLEIQMIVSLSMWVSWNSTTVCWPRAGSAASHSLIQLTLMSWIKDIRNLSPKADAGFHGCQVVGVNGLDILLEDIKGNS